MLVARDAARLDALAKRLREDYRVAVDVLPADLTAPAELARVEARLREDARIGVLINNAGTATAGGFADASPDALEQLIRLNIVAVTRLASAVTPRFLADGGGAIVNIASVLAVAPELMPGIYAASMCRLSCPLRRAPKSGSARECRRIQFKASWKWANWSTRR